jgi:hypothetical protein
MTNVDAVVVAIPDALQLSDPLSLPNTAVTVFWTAL